MLILFVISVVNTREICAEKFQHDKIIENQNYTCSKKCMQTCSFVISTRPLLDIDGTLLNNGNHPRIRGYKSTSTICCALLHAGISELENFQVRKIEEHIEFDSTYQNGISSLASSSDKGFYIFVDEKRGFLPKTTCEVMRHIGNEEIENFAIAESSYLYEFEGAENISSSWNGRRALSDIEEWPSREELRVDNLPFAWISEPLDEDENPNLTFDMKNTYTINQLRFTGLTKIKNGVNTKVIEKLYCEEVLIESGQQPPSGHSGCTDFEPVGNFSMLTDTAAYGWLNLDIKAKCLRFSPKKCKKYAAMKLSLFGCLDNQVNTDNRQNETETIQIMISTMANWFTSDENQIIFGVCSAFVIIVFGLMIYCFIQIKNRDTEREEAEMKHAKNYEEIKLKLELLGENVYPKQTPTPVRQPFDKLPDLDSNKESKYVGPYQNKITRAESHQDLLHQRIFEPNDRIYSSIDNLADFEDSLENDLEEKLTRAHSSPVLEAPDLPIKPIKPPKKPIRKSKKVPKKKTDSDSSSLPNVIDTPVPKERTNYSMIQMKSERPKDETYNKLLLDL